MTFPGTRLYPSDQTFPNNIYTAPDGIGVMLGTLGLTGVDVFGVSWHTLSPLVGWDGSPAGSEQVSQRPRNRGGYGTTPNLMAARPVTLNGLIDAPDPDSLQGAIDRLNAACTFSDTILSLQRGTVPARSLICHRQGEVLIADVTDTLVNWTVQMIGLDPLKYGTAVSGTTGLPSVSGGLTIPFTIPFSINSVVVSGNVVLTNPGNAVGPVKLRIDGPITGPVITHQQSGAVLAFDPTLVIPAGSWLDVDLDNENATLNGQASRNGYITERGWSGFWPGLNLWAFTATTGTGRLTVTGTPAWQ